MKKALRKISASSSKSSASKSSDPLSKRSLDEEAGGGGMGHLEDEDDPELDPVLDEERQQSMPVKWRSAHTINERAAGYVLEVLFKRIESESLDEKYMPSFLHDPIQSFIQKSHRKARAGAFDALEANKETNKKARAHFIIRDRSPWLPFCVSPLLALRARILYVLLPADETYWFTLRGPLPFILTALFATSYAGIQIWAYTLLYLLIDRRDEYQLCRFITSFKIMQFLWTGLVPFFFLLGQITRCLMYLEEAQQHFESAGELCVEMRETYTRPVSAADYVGWVAETIRILLVWHAFAKLRGGVHGGKRQLQALEYVRVDAADGKMDGHGRHMPETLDESSTTWGGASTPQSRLEKMRTIEACWRCGKFGKLWHEMHTVYEKTYRDVLAKERADAAKEGRKAPRRRDGGACMRYLVRWEALTVVLTCGWFAISLYSAGESALTTSGPFDFYFWVLLEMAVTGQALLGFPFLIFLVVPTRTATRASPTGYDRRGWLGQALSMAEVRKVRERIDAAVVLQQAALARHGKKTPWSRHKTRRKSVNLILK